MLAAPLITEQRFHKLITGKGAEILNTLPGPNEPDREVQLLRHSEGNAPLGSAIELCEHNAAELGGGGKHLRLAETILAQGGIED